MLASFSQVSLYLDPKLPAPLASHLRAAFRTHQLPLAEHPAGALRVCELDAVADDASGQEPLLVLYDGKLAAAHAALVRRPVAALLLACRDAGLPSEWELRAVCSLLGAPCNPIGESVRKFRVGRVSDINAASDAVAELVRALGGGRSVVELAMDVVHELAANALLDAPADAAGNPKYAHQRGPDVVVAEADACELTFSHGSGRLYLSATDRFGRFGPGPLANAISKYEQRAQVDSSGGGAGLGMRRLLEHSDLLAIRVIPARMTQVIAALELGPARRRSAHPKSALYYVEQG